MLIIANRSSHYSVFHSELLRDGFTVEEYAYMLARLSATIERLAEEATAEGENEDEVRDHMMGEWRVLRDHLVKHDDSFRSWDISTDMPEDKGDATDATDEEASR